VNNANANVPANSIADNTANNAANNNIVNVSGTLENGTIYKQPLPGLGGGTSFGVVAAVKNDAQPQPQAEVGLDGYCPVSLTEKTQWVKGNPEITAQYEGVLFRFASAESQIKFTSRPEFYAPILKGLDVVEWTVNRRNVPGIRKFGGWYRGKIFLFVNAENYEKFRANPEFYLQKFQQTTPTIAAAGEVKTQN